MSKNTTFTKLWDFCENIYVLTYAFGYFKNTNCIINTISRSNSGGRIFDHKFADKFCLFG